MKTISATAWNNLIDRLRRDQVLGCTVLQSGAWKHPWQVSAAWNPDLGQWEAEIQPGFVNGLDAEVSLRAEEAPEATLVRLGLKPDKAGDDAVDAWLTEQPRLPLTQWRAIGSDAPPESVSLSGPGDIVTSHESVPEFFLALGVTAPPRELFSPSSPAPGTRLLRATEIVLRKDRLTTGSDWTFGAGIDGTFAQFNVTYHLPPGARERAYLRCATKYVPPQPPDPIQQMQGVWEDEGYDPLHIATVYLLSPPDAPAGSEPGPEWAPHMRHRVFWNLVHATNLQPPEGGSDNMTLFTGLAGGIADPIFNEMLATINDKNDALMEFLGNRTIEGHFWNI